jgi:hypothetical protein
MSVELDINVLTLTRLKAMCCFATRELRLGSVNHWVIDLKLAFINKYIIMI